MLSRNTWVRYQALDQLKPAFAEPTGWLSEAERREVSRYRDLGRWQQWIAGRWLAKRLLSEQLVPWFVERAEIEILSRDEQGRAVRPVVRIQGVTKPWSVSISHSNRGVLVGVSLMNGLTVGVDLAEREALNPQALVFWFSAAERQRLRDADPRQTATCWAIKEAVYKAINTGESFVPKKFEVFRRSRASYDCQYDGVSLAERSRLCVWEVDDHVAVTALVSASPLALSDVPQLGGLALERLPLAERWQAAALVGIT